MRQSIRDFHSCVHVCVYVYIYIYIYCLNRMDRRYSLVRYLVTQKGWIMFEPARLLGLGNSCSPTNHLFFNAWMCSSVRKVYKLDSNL
jgi:hypothetical protein